MNMTREEAIDILENEKMCVNNETCQREECATCSLVMDKDKILTALDMALSALRPVSREQVEKVWRGEWMGSADGYADGELVYDTWECSHCGYVIDEEDDPDMLPQFCPKCYAAMTDEAVDMVMERWKEAVVDEA